MLGMVSRETLVHLGSVLAALSLLVVSGWLFPALDGSLLVFVYLCYHALIFGGAHAYFAWRGEAGTVPVPSRWRFLWALAAWIVLGVVGALGPDWTVQGVPTDAVMAGLGVVVLLGYWILEAQDGYRSSRPT